MAATFNDLVTDVYSMLHGYARAQEQSTYLTADLTSGATSMSVNDPDRVSRGIVEIDDELLYVLSSDRSTGGVEIAPFGRGYLGGTAAPHSTGAQVLFSPLFPKTRIRKAINDTILSVGDQLFVTGTSTFSFTPNIVTYSMPADLIDVLQVSFDTVGPSQMWFPLNRYRLDVQANTTDFPTGKTIDIFDPVTPGRTVQVKYTKYPSELVNASDGFASTTGLLESSRDCIVYGAAARMISGIDSALLNTQALEGNVLDDKTQPGMGGSLARQLYQLHRQRLMEERQRYLNRFPTTVYYAR